MKRVRIRSFSGPYFPAFGLNTERYSVSLRIKSKCGKIQTRKSLNTDSFHAVTSCLATHEATPKQSFLCQISSPVLLIAKLNCQNIMVRVVHRRCVTCSRKHFVIYNAIKSYLNEIFKSFGKMTLFLMITKLQN